MKTRAHKKLQALLDRGHTQTEIARTLQVRRPSVSAWVHDRARPEHHLRAALERVYGIPADDWYTDAEYKQAYGCARAAATRP